METTAITIAANGSEFVCELEDNDATRALVELLREGPVTYMASDYGGFEKVGSIGSVLPASDAQMSAEPGDVMLYQGDTIVIFYGSNSWAYTRIGRIEDSANLEELMGSGDVEITLALE